MKSEVLTFDQQCSKHVSPLHDLSHPDRYPHLSTVILNSCEEQPSVNHEQFGVVETGCTTNAACSSKMAYQDGGELMEITGQIDDAKNCDKSKRGKKRKVVGKNCKSKFIKLVCNVIEN